MRSTAALEDHIKPATERAALGSGIGWHTFRDTYRTLVDETGAPIKVQQELMRHADIRTTLNVYGKAMDESKRQAHGKVVRVVLATGSSLLDAVGRRQTVKPTAKTRVAGGRCRIRTYDFHRVRMALYR